MPSARYAIFILPEKSLLSQVSKVDCEPPDRHSTSKKASGKVTPSAEKKSTRPLTRPLRRKKNNQFHTLFFIFFLMFTRACRYAPAPTP